MLIYSDNYRGWGKQKPKQWGPFSAVQGSLFANAERLGIDPNTIVLAMPMWSAVDLVDYSQRHHVFSTGFGTTVFRNGSVYFDGSASRGTLSKFPNIGFGQYTSLTSINFDDNASGGFFGFGNYAPAFSRGANGAIYIYDGGNLGDSSYVDAGVDHNLAFVRESIETDGTLYYIDGFLDTKVRQASSIINTKIVIGSDRYSAVGLQIEALISQHLFFNTALSAVQIARMSDSPYELWKPVAPTLIFDLDTTGGGTPVSVLYDSAVSVSNDSTVTFDQRAAALNERTSSADTKVSIGNQEAIVVDFDTLLGVSNELTGSYDTRVSVGTQDTIVVPFDTITTVRNELTKSFDTRTIVSGLITVIESFDTRLDVSTIRKFLFDTLTLASDGQCVNLCQNDINLIVDMVVARLEPIIEANALTADEVWRYER